MKTSWVSSSKALPRDGEPVQFRVDSHQIVLSGTYANGTFHSRWADYVANKIDAWQGLDMAPELFAIPEPGRARSEASVTMWKRLGAIFARHASITPELIAPILLRTCAHSVAVPAMRVGAFRPNASDSNQMSS